jgi:folate-binding Fe-S cluster repair protein YgfZ
VSFTKGCYVGQELTSRMKHRATARKRILTVAADRPLPPAGTALIAAGQEIGEILSPDGFALVRLDRLGESNGPITAGEIAVALVRPSWLDPAHEA